MYLHITHTKDKHSVSIITLSFESRRYGSVKEDTTKRKIDEIIDLALKGVALAMGIAVVVLSIMKQIEVESAMTMLGIGLASLAITSLSKKGE